MKGLQFRKILWPRRGFDFAKPLTNNALLVCYGMSKVASEPVRLVEFISRSINEHGHCTIRDKSVLMMLSGGTRNCEANIRRLRLFACQHDWSVTSHMGRTAVFTSLSKGPSSN